MMQIRILLSLTLSLRLQECWGRGVLLLRVCIDQYALYKSSWPLWSTLPGYNVICTVAEYRTSSE